MVKLREGLQSLEQLAGKGNPTPNRRSSRTFVWKKEERRKKNERCLGPLIKVGQKKKQVLFGQVAFIEADRCS